MNGKRKFDNGQEQERVPDAKPDEQYKPDMRWKNMILISIKLVTIKKKQY